ncbi:MAG TPA: DUF488 domain-containing protein [Pyrinomonadaceae bacterium]|jgi:uncharacterized protein (DUF488 family)
MKPTQAEAHTLFTIGHSTHEITELLYLLQLHNVTAVADVRSYPYSQRSPQFNREGLSAVLQKVGLAYVFLGKELGGRSGDPGHYVNGKVAYERVAASALFADGIERLLKGLQRYSIALLCAEKDPLFCHRTILVSRHVRGHGVSIAHILEDGTIETQEAVEGRLLRMWGLDQPNIFSNRDELLDRAYELQGERIAFAKLPAQMQEEPTG